MNDCAVDTNIALCILNPSHPSHGSVLRLLRDLREDSRIVLPPQACYEAYVVLTRPKLVNGFDLTSSAAYIEIDKLRRAFTVLPDPSEILDVWLDLCREHGVSGKPRTTPASPPTRDCRVFLDSSPLMPATSPATA